MMSSNGTVASKLLRQFPSLKPFTISLNNLKFNKKLNFSRLGINMAEEHRDVIDALHCCYLCLCPLAMFDCYLGACTRTEVQVAVQNYVFYI